MARVATRSDQVRSGESIYAGNDTLGERTNNPRKVRLPQGLVKEQLAQKRIHRQLSVRFRDLLREHVPPLRLADFAGFE